MKWQWFVNIHSILISLLPARVTNSGHFPVRINYSFLYRSAIIIATLGFNNAYSQGSTDQQQQDYLKVIKTRSEKIVDVLDINNSDKYNAVLNELIHQYYSINTIHEQNKEAIARIKQQALSKEEAGDAMKKQELKKNEQLEQQHGRFIAQLRSNLTDEQLEKVKDGMTYRVFPITYAGYLDMLPALTTEQKNQVYTWLKEARELAMDAESSEKKHAVFGKYKGRINNYLSKAGYDMNKENKAWQERVKQRQKIN